MGVGYGVQFPFSIACNHTSKLTLITYKILGRGNETKKNAIRQCSSNPQRYFFFFFFVYMFCVRQWKGDTWEGLKVDIY